MSKSKYWLPGKSVVSASKVELVAEGIILRPSRYWEMGDDCRAVLSVSSLLLRLL